MNGEAVYDTPETDALPGTPQRPLRALIIEDSPEDAFLLQATLELSGFSLTSRRVDTAADMIAALNEVEWDIIFSDHSMPTFNSIEALDILKRRTLDIPFIIVSGSILEEVAVECMRNGASDYILKGNLKRLPPAVTRELRDARIRKARREMEKAFLAREEQLRIAREVQQQLFPDHAPALPRFNIAGASLPADETGGDYFDYIMMPDGSLCVVIADVTGHGIGPALLMVETRECLRALTSTTCCIRETLLRADKLLTEDFGGSRFVSLLIGQLSSDAESISYLNAGHPDGYIIDIDGNVRHVITQTSPVLGLGIGNESPPPVKVDLSPGDLIVFLTDGVIEALSPSEEEFGAERALAIVRENRGLSSSEIVTRLCAAVQAHRATQAQQDDVTAIIIKVE